MFSKAIPTSYPFPTCLLPYESSVTTSVAHNCFIIVYSATCNGWRIYLLGTCPNYLVSLKLGHCILLHHNFYLWIQYSSIFLWPYLHSTCKKECKAHRECFLCNLPSNKIPECYHIYTALFVLVPSSHAYSKWMHRRVRWHHRSLPCGHRKHTTQSTYKHGSPTSNSVFDGSTDYIQDTQQHLHLVSSTHLTNRTKFFCNFLSPILFNLDAICIVRSRWVFGCRGACRTACWVGVWWLVPFRW